VLNRRRGTATIEGENLDSGIRAATYTNYLVDLRRVDNRLSGARVNKRARRAKLYLARDIVVDPAFYT
jgi:hypothetical protein